MTTAERHPADALSAAVRGAYGTLQAAARACEMDPGRLSGILSGRLRIGRRGYAGRASEAERLAALIGWDAEEVIAAADAAWAARRGAS